MKKDFLLTTLFSCWAVLAAANTAHAQAGSAEQARLQRNLDIMELVLDRLLEVQSAPGLRWRAPATRATYLPGFGVLFKVPSAQSISFFEFGRETRGNSARVHQEYFASGSGAATNMLPEKTSRDEAILDFFAHWTGTLDYLNENERIAIYRDSRPEVSALFDFGGETTRRVESGEEEMLALVRQPDLAALHTGKLDRAQFQARMQSKKMNADDHDLSRIAAAIGRAVSNRAGEARGIYLENYGAVFFTNAQLGRSFMENFWLEDEAESPEKAVDFEEFKTAAQIMAELKRRAEQHAQRMQIVVNERQQNWQSEYGRLKNKLIDLITQQSPALPRLQPQEWIVLVTDLLDAPPHQPNQLIYRIKKQDAEDFNAQKISREQLLKKISYTEN